MENPTQWNEVLRIMGTGFGAVFLIMIMLAVITTLVGKVVQKFEKPKEEEGSTN